MKEFTYRTQMNREYPKPKTDKDPKYLAWVRKQPCVITGRTPCEAHHTQTGGTAMKGSDYAALPLYFEMHREHDRVGKKTFWRLYDVKQIIIDHLVRYIKERR